MHRESTISRLEPSNPTIQLASEITFPTFEVREFTQGTLRAVMFHPLTFKSAQPVACHLPKEESAPGAFVGSSVFQMCS
jgi:hypothetical protein